MQDQDPSPESPDSVSILSEMNSFTEQEEFSNSFCDMDSKEWEDYDEFDAVISQVRKTFHPLGEHETLKV